MLGRVRIVQKKERAREPIVVDDRRFVNLRQPGIEDTEPSAHHQRSLISDGIRESNPG